MQIYIDTADIDEIKHAISLGIVDGVTTNPSLIKKAMDKHKIRDMRQYIEKILETVGEKRPVSLEVIGQTADKMSKEGYELYTTFSKAKYNIAIKIPVNPTISKEDATYFDGLNAIFRISHNPYKIPVNATLIMTPEQAWLAAKAGASYVSPFVGRIDDYLRQRTGIKFNKEDYFPAQDWFASPLLPSVHIHDAKLLDDNGIVSGVDLVEKIVKMFRAEGIETKIIAASVRNARQARELIGTGVDIATIPFNVLKEMASHQKTYDGVESFTNDIVPEYRSLFEDDSAKHKEKPIA